MAPVVQGLVVAMIVAVCALYAAWVLLPSAARRALATAARRLPLPPWLDAPLRRFAADAASGCRCSGCHRTAGAVATGKTQAVFFNPRRRG